VSLDHPVAAPLSSQAGDTSPRILHVSPCMIDTSGKRNGGVAAYIHGLATAQARAGARVRVIYPNVDLGHTFDMAPPTLCDSALFTCVGGLLGREGWFHQIEQSLRDADLVHVHTTYGLRQDWASWRAGRLGKRLLVHSHGKFFAPFRQFRSRAKRLWEQFVWPLCLAHADRVVVSSADEQAGCPPQFRYAYLPNAFNDQVYFPAPVAHPRKDGDYLLYMGTLEKRKNVDFLLDVFARLTGDPLRLVLAGPDTQDLTPALRAQAEALGCADRVDFLGPIYGEAKIDLMRGAWALVLLSRGDVMATVMMEAIGCQVPSIYSDQCAFSALAERGGGIMVPLDIARAAQAIQAMRDDPGARTRQVDALRGIRCDYSWQAVASRSLALYADVLTEG